MSHSHFLVLPNDVSGVRIFAVGNKVLAATHSQVTVVDVFSADAMLP
jgi:hypothetical protein